MSTPDVIDHHNTNSAYLPGDTKELFSKWSEVSFTPNGQAPIFLRDVTITFPDALSLTIGDATDDPEETLGSTGIRIAALKVGNLPILPIGQLGTFQANWLSDNIVVSTHNAKVCISKHNTLVLDAESLDDITNPVTFSRVRDPRQ